MEKIEQSIDDGSGHRAWVFTCNNYTPEMEEQIQGIECSYLVYGHEQGVEGTPHLQGYIEFSSVNKFEQVRKKLVHSRIAPRKGTPQQAAEYCKKDKDYYEKGEISHQGKSQSLVNASKMILEKKPMIEVAKENPMIFIKHFKGMYALQSLMYPKRTTEPYVSWIFGESGRGKTHIAIGDTPPEEVYSVPSEKWFDGYHQQKKVLIDDIDISKWNFKFLLRLLDKYPIQVEIKGGMIEFNSPYIYITDEFPPSYYFHGNTLEQLESRINCIKHITGVNLRKKKSEVGYIITPTSDAKSTTNVGNMTLAEEKTSDVFRINFF
nr:MAG: replication associated protein [Cressdnaviricota sp.]